MVAEILFVFICVAKIAIDVRVHSCYQDMVFNILGTMMQPALVDLFGGVPKHKQLTNDGHGLSQPGNSKTKSPLIR